MRNIILFDPQPARDNLLPLTYLRPVADLRIGIDTIRQKWEHFLPGSYSYRTENYLAEKFATDYAAAVDDNTVFVAGNVLPDAEIAEEIKTLAPGVALVDTDGTTVAQVGSEAIRSVKASNPIKKISMLYDIFQMNFSEIEKDFQRLSANCSSRVPDSTVTIIGDPQYVFIHPDAGDVRGCIINVIKGPVYIGPNAEVMEGSCLRGPIAVCEGSVVNMGCRIYGGTTIGPHSKVGGELNNVVIQAYSNKAHDGFLGNAVIGEWCNLGAGCNASNLKNDYTEIKLWNYPAHRFLRTGLQFCGLIMGDHSKAGINTMLNTATVLGVGVNIHGSGFPRPFLASFSEGSTAGFTDVPMAKFFETARKAMARRNVELTETDIKILEHVRELAEQYR